MATQNQIEANRRNSQKSTGPTSPEGKAASRFNALKTGIHAQSQVIPGEDSAELDALITDYYCRFPPADAFERSLVDSLVCAEWQLRRLRRVEVQLWQSRTDDAQASNIHPLNPAAPLGDVFSRGANAFMLLQRRIDSTERSLARIFGLLERLHAARSQPAQEKSQPPAPRPCPPAPQLASFRNVPQPSNAWVMIVFFLL